jgi:tetratricopeptide (TPR) repeat protein
MTLNLFEPEEAFNAPDSFSPGSINIYMGSPGMISPDLFSELHVPWQNLRQEDKSNIATLLSWHSGISRFVGREKEMEELGKWALSPNPVSAKWITGKSGMGKSRLAAEFSTHMAEKHDWASGFVNLDEPNTCALEKAGVLIVVDHPEERKESVKELLQGLVDIDQKMLVENGKKIRVLFLSRHKFGDWQPIIFETGAEALIDPFPIELPDLPPNSTKEIYHSSFSKVFELSGTQGHPVPEGSTEAWIEQSKDNRRPQLIVAAAVLGALFPEEDILQNNARQIIEKLALQEISRAEGIAASSGLKDLLIFPILQTIANICGGLESEEAVRIMRAADLENEVPEGKDFVFLCNDTDLFYKGQIAPIRPDLLAAAYTVEILRKKPLMAPEIIWFSLGKNFSGSLSHLSRLCFDAEVELGFDKNQLDQWLVQAISEAPDNGAALEPFLVNDLYGLAGSGIITCRICLDQTEVETEKMRLFSKLSEFYQSIGDLGEALKQCVFAVDICEKLAVAQPEAFEPDLARYYYNLWKILFDSGEKGKAYRVIERTAEIYEKLAQSHPRKFKINLVKSLDNLGKAYTETGEMAKALTVTEKALATYEQLASAQPLAFGPAMAACLSSQGNLCSQLGETEKALTATRQAVTIYEQLTAAQPEAFEFCLAASLTDLGNRYADTGETEEALKAIQRALEIYEKLATAQPEVFKPDLAGSLSLEGNLYACMGETEKALEITQRVVEIYSNLAKDTAIYDSLLASSLNNLSSRYASVGEDAKALTAINTAVKIYDSLVEAYPQSFDPHLATSLNTLGVRYAALGENKKALSATQRAIAIYSQLVVAQPELFEPDMAGCLNNQGSLFANMGEREKAIVATEMAVNIKEQLASANPQKFVPSLVKSLNNLEKRYTEIGEEEKARIVRERAEEFQEKYFELLS